MKVTRREFVQGLAAGATVLSLQACGGGGESGSGGFGLSCSATLITLNHGHALTIPSADLDSASPVTYSIQGTADHNHQITLSVKQLKDLKAGNGVFVTSTSTTTVANGAHTHDVTSRC